MIRWFQVAVWMLLIFGFSTDAGSAEQSSRFIGPFLRWLIPGISADAISTVQLAVRKTAHLVEYAILSILVWRALTASKKLTAWSKKPAIIAVCVAAVYAITDEFHQSFVASRSASAGDVLIDTIGAVLGVTLIYLTGRFRKVW